MTMREGDETHPVRSSCPEWDPAADGQCLPCFLHFLRRQPARAPPGTPQQPLQLLRRRHQQPQHELEKKLLKII